MLWRADTHAPTSLVESLRDGAPTVRTEQQGAVTIGYDANGNETLRVRIHGDEFRVDAGEQTLLLAHTHIESLPGGAKITVSTNEGDLALTTDLTGNATDVSSTLPDALNDALSNHNALFATFNVAPRQLANGMSMRISGCGAAGIGLAAASAVGLFPHPVCKAIGAAATVGKLIQAVVCAN